MIVLAVKFVNLIFYYQFFHFQIIISYEFETKYVTILPISLHEHPAKCRRNMDFSQRNLCLILKQD